MSRVLFENQTVLFETNRTRNPRAIMYDAVLGGIKRAHVSRTTTCTMYGTHDCIFFHSDFFFLFSAPIPGAGTVRFVSYTCRWRFATVSPGTRPPRNDVIDDLRTREKFKPKFRLDVARVGRVQLYLHLFGPPPRRCYLHGNTLPKQNPPPDPHHRPAVFPTHRGFSNLSINKS